MEGKKSNWICFCLQHENIPSLFHTHYLSTSVPFFLFLCVWALGEKYGNSAVFSSPSRSLCIRPLSLFVLPVSVPGCIFIYACPRELSQCRFLQACIWMTMWLTVFAQYCLCITVCEFWMCVSLAALHALWSLLSFLPLMFFPAVCKLPHWCTILSCMLRFCHCKCLNKYVCVCVCVCVFTPFLLYLSHISLHDLTHSPLSSLAIVFCHLAIVLGVEGRGRRWNWVEICQTWWCSPTLLPHRSVWMKVKYLCSDTFTHTNK